MTTAGVAFYAGDGARLRHYALDVDNFAVRECGVLELPTEIQYAAGHTDLPLMYVGCGVRDGDGHLIATLDLEPTSGAPSRRRADHPLERRPIDLAVDHPTMHCLVAYTNPGGLDVFAVDPAGGLLDVVQQDDAVDVGAFPHEIRVAADNRHCTVVTRGVPSSRSWWRAKGRQKQPGAIRTFDYADGRLGAVTTLTIGDGYEFGPRNLDLHASGRWAYVAIETQNEVMVLAADGTGRVAPGPLQRLSNLADPDGMVHQIVGSVLAHPRGDVVYVANRSHLPFPYTDGSEHIRPEAENTVVVYATDADTGLLSEIQRVDSGGVGPRALALDPSVRMLVVANGKSATVRDADGGVRAVAKNVSTFEVHDDGRLTLRNRVDIDDHPEDIINWAGLVSF